MAADPAPFILTLILDDTSQARFDTLRTAHFPADRLVVGAHVTLFHALPSDLDISDAARQAAAEAPFPVQVTGLRFLGHGVAFVLNSARLQRLREGFRARWAARLTPQDRQAWRPHVTIQNKVEPAVAKALHMQMSAGFMPYEVIAIGLHLWIYRNGPWQAAGAFPFKSDRFDD
ncbi:2'-5' RNA ligase family protein [Rhodopila sp.]|uniref:2'-5' RNA ligase family protein n=1 Tax=Rhodopila sp. TaxID=2480087 RepID=UPI003D10EAF2